MINPDWVFFKSTDRHIEARKVIITQYHWGHVMYFGIFHKLSTLHILFLFLFSQTSLVLWFQNWEVGVNLSMLHMTLSSKVASQGLLSSQRSLGTTAGGRWRLLTPEDLLCGKPASQPRQTASYHRPSHQIIADNDTLSGCTLLSRSLVIVTAKAGIHLHFTVSRHPGWNGEGGTRERAVHAGACSHVFHPVPITNCSSTWGEGSERLTTQPSKHRVAPTGSRNATFGQRADRIWQRDLGLDLFCLNSVPL